MVGLGRKLFAVLKQKANIFKKAVLKASKCCNNCNLFLSIVLRFLIE